MRFKRRIIEEHTCVEFDKKKKYQLLECKKCGNIRLKPDSFANCLMCLKCDKYYPSNKFFELRRIRK